MPLVRRVAEAICSQVQKRTAKWLQRNQPLRDTNQEHVRGAEILTAENGWPDGYADT
ncbi:hypothetical protein [Ensifer aridi]|uniref:hypothetical protein n=1 Tax=Ensifer aridi TaxID=1708715 RepID=UPI000410D275|nr:hypothetical protein [Ensifer aridi]